MKCKIKGCKDKKTFRGYCYKHIPVMQRQSMNVTPIELFNLGIELLIQQTELHKELYGKTNTKKALNQKFSVSIINKSKASDTWVFE